MSINNATPADWDRLRKQHPPLEVTKPTIDESMMKVYLDEAQEEINSMMRTSQWYQQHAARLRQEEYNSRWGNFDDGDEEEMSKEELTSYIFDDEEEDVVNNPDHYNTGNIECIEAIEESMSSVAFKGYLKGNCMKYVWRYDYKGKQVEDLQKAQWYLAKLTQVVVFENEDNS
jgi:hypothetical protein